MSLESTHIETDLNTTYKIAQNLIDVSLIDVGLSLPRNKTRSAGRKFEHKVHHSNIMASKYMHRLYPIWNSLLDGLVTANKSYTVTKQFRSLIKDIVSNFRD